ncbi:hypothetical protein [Staphylococcus equorum]|uniref:Uncharacterized protein n=1 Tax=Staphylococcus equorum TaxID=246432 RepID=A0AAP7LUW1_9STAP|nr:hypothetical protein [Staphylococcus equorum]OEK58923.1 hypothetical protein ASS94_00950 [Staphylococcus equorum]
MSISKENKDRLSAVINKHFENPEELGRELVEEERNAMKEMIEDNKGAYGYPHSVKSEELVEYLKVFIKSKISTDEWIEIIDNVVKGNLSDEDVVEEVVSNEVITKDIIFMNLDDCCDCQILLPEYEDYQKEKEQPEDFEDKQETFEEEIESVLREKSPNEIKEAVKTYSDEADIKEAVRKAGIEAGIPEDKVDEITKYDFKNLKITIPISFIASRYHSDAVKEGKKTFLENNLLKALVQDNSISYDIEILDNPEDF